MKYKVNDVVRLSELNVGAHAGEAVIIIEANEATGSYEYLIPEVRGSCVEANIERKVSEVMDWKTFERCG
jgi:hypothetical protein